MMTIPLLSSPMLFVVEANLRRHPDDLDHYKEVLYRTCAHCHSLCDTWDPYLRLQRRNGFIGPAIFGGDSSTGTTQVLVTNPAKGIIGFLHSAFELSSRGRLPQVLGLYINCCRDPQRHKF
jgi:hypothetical protein